MANLLVELGTEELPLSALDVIYRDLEEIARKKLAEKLIDHGTIRVEATPQRTVLYIEGLASKQKDEHLEIKGPAVEKAYDGSGKPTKALEGFLRSKGAKVSDLTELDSPKGKIVLLKKTEKGKTTQSVLPEVLGEIFNGLAFPKLMRWEASGFKYPRPVRWVVVLLDSKVLRFEFAGTKAANKTKGHRFLAPKTVALKSANWKSYVAALKKVHVHVELEAREKKIRETLKTKYKQKVVDEELVHLNAQLVEEPFFLEGSFRKEYLDLPAEVLSTSMKKNQKTFACLGPKGKLQPKFIAVLNGKRSGLKRIQFDYENVLESRLKDARFFFDADSKEPLEKKTEELGQITYLGKLGTFKDKVDRMSAMSADFSKLLGEPDLAGDLARVVTLSKADLLSQLVYEFPELQGIAGRSYALRNGENPEVAAAIGMQYLPKNISETPKEIKKTISKLGALFGILDRFDLIYGAFGTGLEPTGSQDPYALRRACGVMIKLVRTFEFPFSISKIFDQLSDQYQGKLDSDPAQKLTEFIRDRVVFDLGVKPGQREYEVFMAVWNANHDDLTDVYARYEVLLGILKKDPEGFYKVGKVVERTGNIVKQAKGELKVQSELLQDPLEKKLYELIEQKSQSIEASIQDKNYEEATRLFGATFYQPVHDFFEQVMVNVEDTSIRQNRQALMRQINRLYTAQLADLSVLSRLEE